MKILLVGCYRFFWYEEVCAQALATMGHDVVRFSWEKYFSSLIGRVEEHLLIRGWSTHQLEADLLKFARTAHPDVIWIWRGLHVRSIVVRRLRENTGAVLVSYNNDDPFSRAHRRVRPHASMMDFFIQSIKEYDINFVFRPGNIQEYRDHGAKWVAMLPPYFIRDLHRPTLLSDVEQNRYGCDLVFVGHHEEDGRENYLRALVKAGYQLRIYGTGWPERAIRAIYGSPLTVFPVFGEEYVRALSGAKLCLSFLSKLNRDTYTTRSFEIPACAKVMIGERTADLESLFRDGEEAAYFSTAEEMLQIVRDLLANEDKRRSIERAARHRCVLEGYDEFARMDSWVDIVRNHPRLRRAERSGDV